MATRLEPLIPMRITASCPRPPPGVTYRRRMPVLPGTRRRPSPRRAGARRSVVALLVRGGRCDATGVARGLPRGPLLDRPRRRTPRVRPWRRRSASLAGAPWGRRACGTRERRARARCHGRGRGSRRVPHGGGALSDRLRGRRGRPVRVRVRDARRSPRAGRGVVRRLASRRAGDVRHRRLLPACSARSPASAHRSRAAVQKSVTRRYLTGLKTAVESA